jgi:Undecaprenyl-phosphate glucose phosphotransferase
MLGVFDDRWSRSSAEVGTYPVLGNIDDLIEFGQTLRLDDIIVALPWTDEARIGRILAASRVLAANIHLGPDLAGHTFAGRPHAKRGGLFVITIAAKPLQGWLSIAKMIEDKLVAFAGLVLLSPILLASAIAVKLESPGPILFRQKRFGFNNALFDVYKFRTMHHVVRDQHAEELAHRNDARVTRVGRFLRRFSIDELPQLINVLEGTMSIVGPRPHAVKAKAGGKLYTALANYAERHRIKPGITGWAQINGWRGETDTQEKLAGRINCDMFYIEHCSIAFDLRIILLTCFKVFSSENAY